MLGVDAQSVPSSLSPEGASHSTLASAVPQTEGPEDGVMQNGRRRVQHKLGQQTWSREQVRDCEGQDRETGSN